MQDHEQAPDYAIDELAERQVLGLALNAPDLARPTFERLNAIESWTNERRLIAAAIADLYSSDEPVEPQTVQRVVTARAGTDDVAARVAMQVITMWQEGTGGLESLRYWAERVYRVARARAAQAAATLLKQRIDQSLRNDDQVGFDRAMVEHAAAIEQAALPLDQVVAPPMNYPALAAVPFTYDWVIPGLLERGDRLILTGMEGLGKSELLIQMAMTSATGLHMFTGRPLALAGGGPVTVMVVDAENSQRQLARRYRRVAGLVENLCEVHGLAAPGWVGDDDDGSIRYVIRPEGIPLSDPRELARLERSIAATQPALVLVGPHYKLTGDRDYRDEQEAKVVTTQLDELRVRHGFALIVEAHSPHSVDGRHRDLRPLGSSVFRRWPEFGYGLAPAPGCEDEDQPTSVKFHRWRGDRDVRAWPTTLTRMRSLSWMPYGPYNDWLDNGGEQVA